MSLRIVKLGGSLLDLEHLIPRLRTWLARQTVADTVLVVGGGAMADSVRVSQRLHGISESAAHWLCVRAMVVQAEMMRSLLPESEWAGGLAAIRRLSVSGAPHSPPAAAGARNRETQPSTTQGRLFILDPWHFLREEEPRSTGGPLPESWAVTSDSIAARLAELASADELVLLKSALPRAMTFADMAEEGYVDSFFPQAVATLAQVKFVDLRVEPCRETTLSRDAGLR